MHSKPIFLTVAASLAFAPISRSQGQGPLVPPGPPADGVYHTLTEIYDRAGDAQPRIPINTAHTTIDQPGSYLLIANLTQTAGTPLITITSENVNLDLGGFTLIASPESSTFIDAIHIDASHVTVANGQIVGQRNGGPFGGPSIDRRLENGIVADSTRSSIRISSVSIARCRSNGIDCDFSAGSKSMVENAVLTKIDGLAVRASSVVACAVNESGRGIDCQTAHDCSVKATTNAIVSFSAFNCVGESDTGVGVAAQSATNCHGRSTSGNGLSATNANNCIGISDSGVGLVTTNAITCHAETASGLRALSARSVSYSTAAHGGGGVAIDSQIAVACVVIGSGTVVAPEKHLGTP